MRSGEHGGFPDTRARAALALLLAGLLSLALSSRPAETLLSLGRADYMNLSQLEDMFRFSILVCSGFALLSGALGTVVQRGWGRVMSIFLAGTFGAFVECLFPLIAEMGRGGFSTPMSWAVFHRLVLLQEIIQFPGTVLSRVLFHCDFQAHRWTVGLVSAPVEMSIRGVTNLVAANSLAYCATAQLVLSLFTRWRSRAGRARGDG